MQPLKTVPVLLMAALLLASCRGTMGSSSEPGSTASASVSSGSTPSVSSTPSSVASEPSGYQALIRSGQITSAEICDEYSTRLTRFIDKSKAQIVSGNKYVDDARQAKRYVDNVEWVDSDPGEILNESLTQAATAALNDVTDGQAGLLDDVGPYLEDSLEACGLSELYASASQNASTAKRLALDLYAEAENAPWYPRGYEEWTDGIAFKFNRAATNSSYLWGWAYDVITRDGCADGLYVEVNFLSSGGTVLDWGNDRLSALAPGQKGRMEFRVGTSSGGVDSFETTEINCYD